MTPINMHKTLTFGKNRDTQPSESLNKILKFILVHFYNDTELCRLTMKPKVLEYVTRELFALSNSDGTDVDINVPSNAAQVLANDNDNDKRDPGEVVKQKLLQVASHFKKIQIEFTELDRDVVSTFNKILEQLKTQGLKDMMVTLKNHYTDNIHTYLPDVNDFHNINTFGPETLYIFRELFENLLLFSRLYIDFLINSILANTKFFTEGNTTIESVKPLINAHKTLDTLNMSNYSDYFEKFLESSTWSSLKEIVPRGNNELFGSYPGKYPYQVIEDVYILLSKLSNAIFNLQKKFEAENSFPMNRDHLLALKYKNVLINQFKTLVVDTNTLNAFRKQREIAETAHASNENILPHIEMFRLVVTNSELLRMNESEFQVFHKSLIDGLNNEHNVRSELIARIQMYRGEIRSADLRAYRDQHNIMFIGDDVKAFNEFEALYNSLSENNVKGQNNLTEEMRVRERKEFTMKMLNSEIVPFSIIMDFYASNGKYSTLRNSVNNYFSDVIKRKENLIYNMWYKGTDINTSIIFDIKYSLVHSDSLRRQCKNANYTFLDPDGNPFADIVNPVKKETPKEKNELSPDHIPLLNQIHNLICVANTSFINFHHKEEEFSNSNADYIIVLNGNYQAGSFYKPYGDGWAMEVVDTSTGSYNKIEIRQNSTKQNPEYWKRSVELPDLLFITSFDFVGSLKGPTYLIQTSKTLDQYTKTIHMGFTKYKNSPNSVPTINDNLSKVLDHSYAYKTRRHGKLYCVFYDDEGNVHAVDNDKYYLLRGAPIRKTMLNPVTRATEIIPVHYHAGAKEKFKRLEDGPYSLDPYTREALRYGFDMTKVHIIQNENTADNSRNSVHTPDTFVTMSVVCPDDIFYKPNFDIPYDVNIEMANIFPYMPILGLFHKHETESRVNKNGRSTATVKDRNWLRKMVDIHGRNGNAKCIEVYDGNTGKIVQYRAQRKQVNTSSIALYCASLDEYGLELVTMNTLNMYDISNILAKNLTATWNQYSLSLSDTIRNYIIENSTNKYFSHFVTHQLGDIPFENKELKFTQQIIPRIANTIYSKMKTFKMGVPAEEYPRYYDLTFAMNSNKFKQFEFLRTRRVANKVNLYNEHSFNHRKDNINFRLTGKVTSVAVNEEKAMQELSIEIDPTKILRTISIGSDDVDANGNNLMDKYYNILANFAEGGTRTSFDVGFNVNPPLNYDIRNVHKIKVPDNLKFVILKFLLTGDIKTNLVKVSELNQVVTAANSTSDSYLDYPSIQTGEELVFKETENEYEIIDLITKQRTVLNKTQKHNITIQYKDEIFADPQYRGYLNNVDMTFITVLDQILSGDKKTMLRFLFQQYNNSDMPISEKVADFLHETFQQKFTNQKYREIYHLLSISGSENSILTGDVPLKPKSEDRPITIVVNNIDWE